MKKYNKFIVSKEVVDKISSQIIKENIENKRVKNDHVRSVRGKISR